MNKECSHESEGPVTKRDSIHLAIPPHDIREELQQSQNTTDCNHKDQARRCRMQKRFPERVLLVAKRTQRG
jgi:hypothetical protein